MKVPISFALLMLVVLMLSACEGVGGGPGVATATPIPTIATATTAAGTTIITETTVTTETDVMTGTGDVTPGTGITETGAVDAAETTAVRGAVRASELLGYDVQNFEGEDLGSIQDAMISLQDGCIDYMILSFGGILGLGDSQFLIPWRALTVDPDDERVVLNVEPEVLNDAPRFDVDNLPDFHTPDWDIDARTFWEAIELTTPELTGTATMTGTAGAAGDQTAGMGSPCAGALPGFAAEAADTTASETVTDTTGTGEGIAVETPQVSRLSDLLGFAVTNAEGEDLGAIEDIMIDWRQDRIVYAILSFGGLLGLGEKWFPIPLDQITLDPLEQRFVVDAEPERLEAAPGFDEADLPDTTNPNWDEQIRSYWAETQ
jgi:sporulation protein YlmC with PRC-barrel domain